MNGIWFVMAWWCVGAQAMDLRYTEERKGAAESKAAGAEAAQKPAVKKQLPATMLQLKGGTIARKQAEMITTAIRTLFRESYATAQALYDVCHKPDYKLKKEDAEALRNRGLTAQNGDMLPSVCIVVNEVAIVDKTGALVHFQPLSAVGKRSDAVVDLRAPYYKRILIAYASLLTHESEKDLAAAKALYQLALDQNFVIPDELRAILIQKKLLSRSGVRLDFVSRVLNKHVKIHKGELLFDNDDYVEPEEEFPEEKIDTYMKLFVKDWDQKIASNLTGEILGMSSAQSKRLKNFFLGGGSLADDEKLYIMNDDAKRFFRYCNKDYFREFIEPDVVKYWKEKKLLNEDGNPNYLACRVINAAMTVDSLGYVALRNPKLTERFLTREQVSPSESQEPRTFLDMSTRGYFKKA